MKEKFFHIFNVFDYKGGELRTLTNLTMDQAFYEIYNSGILEQFELSDFEDESERNIFNLSDESILKLLNDVYEHEYDLYAGYTGYSYPIIYVINDNILEEYHFSNREKIDLFRRYLTENKEWIKEHLDDLEDADE